MTIDESFGLLPLPVPVAPVGASVGDPLVDKLGAYFMAVLNADADDAWRAVYAPSEPVKRFVPDNPAETAFSAADLPALYLYRKGTTAEPYWLAADYFISPDELCLYWLFPTAGQSTQSIRSSFVNAVGKAILAARARLRHPAWIDPGDTDPRSATHGSNVLDRCGLWRLSIKNWSAGVATRPMQSTPDQTYFAVEATIHVEERWVQNAGSFVPLAALNGRITSPGDPPGADVPFRLDPLPHEVLMPARLRVFACLFASLDHDGRPACVVAFEDAPLSYVGASHRQKVLVQHSTERGNATISDELDITWEADAEPSEVIDAPYYREALRDGHLLPADAATAARCGLAFVEPAKALEDAKATAIARFTAHHGFAPDWAQEPTSPAADAPRDTTHDVADHAATGS